MRNWASSARKRRSLTRSSSVRCACKASSARRSASVDDERPSELHASSPDSRRDRGSPNAGALARGGRGGDAGVGEQAGAVLKSKASWMCSVSMSARQSARGVLDHPDT